LVLDRGFLAAILVATVLLWGPWSNVYFIGPDDVKLVQASAALAAGDWSQLLAPQDVHVLPLFRLLRLWPDTHFPEEFHWLYRLSLLAHLASTGLLFMLSRRWLGASASALAVAALFGWRTLGGDALLISSQNTYVVSLPFLLGALVCLDRLQRPNRRTWAAACLACLSVAVLLHSLVAAAAIPGVLAAYYLLLRSKESDRLVWIACGLPLLLAMVLWRLWGLPGLRTSPDSRHFLAADWGAQFCEALLGTALHFGSHVWRGRPTARVLAALAAVCGLLLWRLRDRPAARWVLASFALTAGPAFLIFLVRTSETYSHSRYAYQAFLPIAVVAGAALSLALSWLASRPALQAAVLALLLATAPLYYLSQRDYLARLGSLHQSRGLPREYWLDWKRFFESAPGPLRLPRMALRPTWTVREVFTLLYPNGKSGIEPAGDSDCAAFQHLAAQWGKTPAPGDRWTCVH